MRWRPGRSCTPYTAATAMRASSRATPPRVSCGAMRRCPEPRERDVTAPPAGAHARPAPQRSQVRWKIFLYLFGFGFILYMQQRAIPVAGIEMMPRLNLSQLQIAWLEQALLVGYTVMQF